MEELKLLWKEEKLQFYGSAEKYRNHYAFKELLDTCYSPEWVPYCKKTFNGAQSVIDYLGKYTHRIAISNHHIIRMDEKTVTFSVKDYRNKGEWKELTLCRNLLGCQKYFSKIRDMEMPEILEHLYEIKICVCKACGGHLGKPHMRLPLRY